jgi:D-alanyl-D-alanine carboxypeptidase
MLPSFLCLVLAVAQTPDVAARLSKTLDSLAAAGEFSGVALLAKDGVPVFERAYGLADREARTPNTVETAFNLGSINKFFTMIALRQLAAAGKLDIDSTLARAWPDYPNQDVGRRVTIQQLLQHRSGVGGNIFGVPAGGKRGDIRRLADYLPLFVNAPLQFEPGTQQRYSNAGYIVLGLLIERLSGENYYDYVRRHIYEPAGMTRTGSWAVDSLPANTAIGYTTRRPDTETPSSGPAVPNTEFLPGRGSSAGGGYSTAHDLLRFIAALEANNIPSGPPGGGGGGGGMGIAGGAPGINASVETGLPGGYDLIVLTNLDPPAAERVARTVRGWLK